MFIINFNKLMLYIGLPSFLKTLMVYQCTIIFGIKNCAILIGIQVSRFRFFQTNLRSCRGRPGLRGVRRPTHAGSWYEARTRPDFASLGTCDLTAVEKEHMYMMLHYMYMCICNIYIYYKYSI